MSIKITLLAGLCSLLAFITFRPINLPSGCKIITRCPLATEKCAKEAPSLEDVGSKHLLACHYIYKIETL
ncbi:oligopeptide/dipeptide ABC transporter ATP-binding protein [Heyndrickxia sporothermodurans]